MANETQGIAGAVQQLGMGERLALAGAAGVLLVWLVFDLGLRDYSVGHAPFLLAVVPLVLAYRVRVQGATPFISYSTVLLLAALGLGVLGVRELLEDIRYEVVNQGGMTMVGAFLYWAAALAAGAGAVLMLQERD